MNGFGFTKTEGEVNIVKIYTEYNTEANDSVEILLNCHELEDIINILTKLKNDIEQFKVQVKNKKNLGFTHLHLKDFGVIDKENSDADLVFYINMDK